jgi:membrane-associated protease RseP (regulator of RpoE activity)
MRRLCSFRVAGGMAMAAGLGLAGLTFAAQPPAPPKLLKTPKPPRTFVWKSMGRGYLGVQVLPLTRELRAHFGAPEDSGVLVAKVEEASPAAAAGIQVGDVLTSIDGKDIQGPGSLARAVRGKKAGDSVNLDFLRDKGPLSAAVEIDEKDRAVVDLADFQLAIPETLPLPEIPPFEGEAGAMIFSPGSRLDLDEDALKAFEDAMRDLGERFDSEEWKEKMQRFEDLDVGKIQERMKEVEERLRKLESELEKEGKKKL